VKINTFKQYGEGQNIIDHLPKQGRDGIWNFNTEDTTSQMMAVHDADYCYECTYLIGVETEEKATYTIDIEQPDNLGIVQKTLTIGIPLIAEVESSKAIWYAVVIGEETELNVFTSVSSGTIDVTAFYDMESKKSQGVVKGGETLVLTDIPEDQETIYLYVKGIHYSFFSLLASINKAEVVMLADGHPVMSEAILDEDNKHTTQTFIVSIPEIEDTRKETTDFITFDLQLTQLFLDSQYLEYRIYLADHLTKRSNSAFSNKQSLASGSTLSTSQRGDPTTQLNLKITKGMRESANLVVIEITYADGRGSKALVGDGNDLRY